MAYIKNNWVDREGTTRYFETVDNDGAKIFTPDYTQVTEIGTPVNADNMNHIEEGIAAGSFTKFDLNATYAKDDLVTVIEDSSPVIYKSLVDNNIGNELSNSIAWKKISLGGSSGAYVGQTIFSLDPLYEDGLHLLDGTELQVGGIYDQFINTYIANLYQKAPQRFCTETEWQASVDQYGVCGKYVYNAGVSVRLPKVTGHVEGTLNASALGDLVEAGLPTLTTNLDGEHSHALYAGDAESGSAFGLGSGRAAGVGGGDNGGTVFYRSTLGNGKQIVSSTAHTHTIQGTADTVQTQSILGYMYIVLATGTKTDIEVDIDNVVTDLNGKVDVSSMVEIDNASSVITAMAMPDLPNAIEITPPYTAPCDGWVYVTVDGTLNGYCGVNVLIDGKGYGLIANANNTTGYAGAIGIAPKGAVINTTVNSGTTKRYFIPCKGAN